MTDGTFDDSGTVGTVILSFLSTFSSRSPVLLAWFSGLLLVTGCASLPAYYAMLAGSAACLHPVSKPSVQPEAASCLTSLFYLHYGHTGNQANIDNNGKYYIAYLANRFLVLTKALDSDYFRSVKLV